MLFNSFAYHVTVILAAVATVANGAPAEPPLVEIANLIPIRDVITGRTTGALAVREPIQHLVPVEERSELSPRLSASGYVCKKTGKKDCFKVTSTGVCKNLVTSDGRPFVSGYAGNGSLCTAYSKKGCPWFSGDKKDFDEAGSSNFGWNARSIKCSIKF